jgi:hypothetical protein
MVSALALAVDMGILLFLAQYTHYLLAATIGFLFGSLIHYLLAIKLVFHTRKLADKAHIEGVIYVAAGLGGLLVNTFMIYAAVEWFAAPLLTAKLMAAAGSLFVGFVTRKLVLFRHSAA